MSFTFRRRASIIIWITYSRSSGDCLLVFANIDGRLPFVGEHLQNTGLSVHSIASTVRQSLSTLMVVHDSPACICCNSDYLSARLRRRLTGPYGSVVHSSVSVNFDRSVPFVGVSTAAGYLLVLYHSSACDCHHGLPVCAAASGERQYTSLPAAVCDIEIRLRCPFNRYTIRCDYTVVR